MTFLNANRDGKGREGAARGLRRASQMRKGAQRATMSRGVTHFINCVGSRGCPLEKSVDLIKLPRTLEEEEALGKRPVKQSLASIRFLI